MVPSTALVEFQYSVDFLSFLEVELQITVMQNIFILVSEIRDQLLSIEHAVIFK